MPVSRSLSPIEHLVDMIKIGDLLASITGEQSSTTTYRAAPATLKRKAEDDLRGQNDKNQRVEPVPTSSNRTMAPLKRPSNLDMQAMKSRPVSAMTTPTAVGSPVTTAARTFTATASPGIPSKPPKKGSFAEIMARGKAASTTMSQVGKIQHKRLEKVPHKREREEDRKGYKAGSSNELHGKSRIGASRQAALQNRKSESRNGSGSLSGRIVEPEKKIKKAALATTGYTGTARPVPGKAASKPAPSYGGSAFRERDRDVGQARRYTYADEDEDEDEDMEQEDYYSDASSDMEAATFEVDEEEERAARIARKEDAAALAEENRLKREKEEKRKRLAAMANKRR